MNTFSKFSYWNVLIQITNLIDVEAIQTGIFNLHTNERHKPVGVYQLAANTANIKLGWDKNEAMSLSHMGWS